LPVFRSTLDLSRWGPVVSSKPKHPLRGLLTAQFFGAFNDNAWKLFVALLGLRALTAERRRRTWNRRRSFARRSRSSSSRSP